MQTKSFACRISPNLVDSGFFDVNDCDGFLASISYEEFSYKITGAYLSKKGSAGNGGK